MAAAVSPLHSSGNFLVFAVDNVFGVVIGRELRVEDIDAAARYSAQIVRDTEERGHCVYIYYATGLAIPSMEVRQATAKLTRASASAKLLARAFVVPGSGFWASAMQGIYTASTAVVPGRFPQRFCADDREAAAFLAPHTAFAMSELMTALERARKQALG